MGRATKKGKRAKGAKRAEIRVRGKNFNKRQKGQNTSNLVLFLRNTNYVLCGQTFLRNTNHLCLCTDISQKYKSLVFVYRHFSEIQITCVCVQTFLRNTNHTAGCPKRPKLSLKKLLPIPESIQKNLR